MAEGHGFEDALHVRLVHEVATTAHGATALGALTLQQMAFAGA